MHEKYIVRCVPPYGRYNFADFTKRTSLNVLERLFDASLIPRQFIYLFRCCCCWCMRIENGMHTYINDQFSVTYGHLLNGAAIEYIQTYHKAQFMLIIVIMWK